MLLLRRLLTRTGRPAALGLSTLLLAGLALAGTVSAAGVAAGYLGYGAGGARDGAGAGYAGGDDPGAGYDAGEDGPSSGRDLRPPKARQLGVPGKIRVRALGVSGVAVAADCGERCTAAWSLEVPRAVARRARVKGSAATVAVAAAAGRSDARGRVRATLTAVRRARLRRLAGATAVLRLDTTDRAGNRSTSTALVKLSAK
jgi:hypothetical protein